MIGVVAIAAIAGVLSLAWALVAKSNECAILRERLAVSRANVDRAEDDVDRVESLYRNEVEKTAALVESIARNETNDDHADPFTLFDRVLTNWRERTTTASNNLRAKRLLRDTPSAVTEPANVSDGSSGDQGVPRIDDENLPGTDPGTPRAIAAKGKKT